MGKTTLSNLIDPEELQELFMAMRKLRRSRSLMTRASWGSGQEILEPNQIGILLLLIENPDGLRIGELATREHSDAGNITRAVGKLLDNGYVKRMPSASDGRGVIVVATPRGRALGKKMISRRDRFLQDTFSQFTPAERRQLMDFLDRINVALESASRAIAPAAESARPKKRARG